MTEGRAEVAIVGGGPAGAAAAIRLAAAGRDVLVLEREREVRHKVCGEFLSVEALAALEALGAPAAGLGAAPIDRLRIGAGDRVAEARLPFVAAGLSRASLDPALLDRAARLGARIVRGASVRGVEREGPGALVRLAGGGSVRAERVVLATGKQELGAVRRPTGWSGREGMIGLKMHLCLSEAAAARLGPTIELHLFPGGCAGLQPVDGAANLCITLSRACFRACGNRFDRLLAFLAEANRGFAGALEGAEPCWWRPLAIARVPYGFLGSAAPGGGGVPLWRVGDQIAVTASFTGDGLAIALESGKAAADAILGGGGPAAYARPFRRRAARQLRPAMALQGLVDRPGLHAPAVGLARRAPWLLGALARWTRLPPPGRSLRRA